MIPRPDWSAVDVAILDMDGTLLDLHFDNQVWNVLLPKRYGELHAIDEIEARKRISHRLGNRRGTLSWYCLDYWSETLSIEIHELEAELDFLISLRPGARGFLEWLGGLGLRLILATNAHPASLERKLGRTGIARYFDGVVSAHVVGAAKESPYFWREIERRFEIVYERAVLIDDNHAVLKTAYDHGIAHVYGISQPDSRQAPVAESTYPCVRSFSELAGEVLPD
jgi:5'-nucleotidase